MQPVGGSSLLSQNRKPSLRFKLQHYLPSGISLMCLADSTVTSRCSGFTLVLRSGGITPQIDKADCDTPH